MRFDAYQATIEKPPAYLRDALAERSGGEWVEARPSERSAATHELLIGGQVHMEMFEGGRYEWPHLKAMGSVSDDAATLIRAVAPVHLVARADVCEDLEAPGWFDRAFAYMVDLAKAERVKPMRAGDWDSDHQERTFYLGATSSDVRVRLYEKGKQMRSEYPAAADQFPLDWVRVEAQVRPRHRESKRTMSLVPASEFWGCSRWSRRLSDELLGVDAPRHSIGTKWNPHKELEKTEHHFIIQYRRMIEQRAEIEGSQEAAWAYYDRLLTRERARRG